MRILHVSPAYFPALGGAQLHLKELSEGLVSRGHDVTVLTPNVRNHSDMILCRGGGLPEHEVINGVKVIRFRPDGGLAGKAIDKWLRCRGGYRSLHAILSADVVTMLSQGPRAFPIIPYILRFHPDVVATISWCWPPAFHTYLARKLKNFTLVGIPLFHTATTWSYRDIYKSMLPQCDAVVVNTRHEGEFVRERGAKRVEVAGVGIHPELFECRSGIDIRARYSLGDRPVVGFVGRQVASKGVTKLVEAMRRVWKWNPDVHLIIAGERAHFRDEVGNLVDGLSDRERTRIVRIDEFHERDKASLYDAFDVLALPSREESFGIAYLEAWMCGKPVIGGRIGSTQCVIDEGVDGLLANPDDGEDIALNIIDLLSDRDKRERMARNGRAKTLAHYTWDKVTDKVEALYRDLIAASEMRQRSDAHWLKKYRIAP
jgi:glycosyltransferase involved in cell wall biosynthesis